MVDQKKPDPLDKLNQNALDKKPSVNLTLSKLDADVSESLKRIKEFTKKESKALDDIEDFIKKKIEENKSLEKSNKALTKYLLESQKEQLHVAQQLEDVQDDLEKTQEEKDYLPSEDLAKELNPIEEEKAEREAKYQIYINANSKEKIAKSVFGKTWDGIKNSSKVLYHSSVAFAKKISKDGFCATIGKKIGDLFSTASGATGRGLLKYITNTKIYKLAFTAFTVIKNFITYAYDFFVHLAKIGWKVVATAFSVITTPIISVAKFLVNILTDFLTSPFGFTVTVLGIVGLSYLFWDSAKEMITKVVVTAWDWVVDGIKKILGEDRINAIENFVGKYTKDIQDFFSGIWNFLTEDDKIAKFYDKYIGNYIGFSSKDISNLWNTGIEVVSTAFDSFVSVFTNVKSGNILDEMLTSWQVIKLLAMGEDDYRSSTLVDQNQSRAMEFLKQRAEEQATAYVQGLIIDNLVNNNGYVDEKRRKELTKIGNDALSNFLDTRKFVSDDKLNKRIKRSISVNVESIVSNLSDKSTDRLNKIKDSLANVDSRNQKFIDDLEMEMLDKRFKDTGFVESTTKYIDDLINSYIKGRSVDEFHRKIHTISKSNEKNFKNKTIDFGNGYSYTLKDNDELLKKYERFISILQNEQSRKAQLRSIEAFLHEIQIPEKVQAFNVLLAGANKNTTDYEELKSNALQPLYIEQAKGGVITGPIHALIGEAGYPEIVLPVNTEGLDFIVKSMKDMMTDETKPDKTDKTKKDIVRRLSKQASKTDTILFDMKNIAQNIIGID